MCADRRLTQAMTLFEPYLIPYGNNFKCLSSGSLVINICKKTTPKQVNNV